MQLTPQSVFHFFFGTTDGRLELVLKGQERDKKDGKGQS